ncbi:hypothetical protein CONLIGDRAFT_618435 [Coniochaeta ligniaria NRRL 30616]|uniref:Heme oxygenase-like protein n=1 Tax=Coniochaeta ligniaria NRRL 30616 TaxID=1408157 RepID=A0A1J7IP10_9PEZI|nr:hypothetical protein CONLIGDRAFT_618435 [Coniochaeta ligniaria NRRL 30616]
MTSLQDISFLVLVPAALFLLFFHREKWNPLTSAIGYTERNTQPTLAGHEKNKLLKPTTSPRLQAKLKARLDTYKDMYYKIQNLEDFPEILPWARKMLLSLLHEGLLMTRYKPVKIPGGSILDITEFDAGRLHELIDARQADVGHEFEAYIRRREAGGGPELFQDLEGARRHLKRSACWNYVDGSWLARTNQITTPFVLRGVTKNAWQIFSEELGDGDLEKNHVVLYRDLLRSVGVDLPGGDTADFIHPRHGMDDEGGWRLSVAQLLLSVFPNDFLPEILGFNLYYESPALSNYLANREMPEFGISPYYYALHISIDNPDSGHCAMALGNIVSFLKVVRETDIMSYENAWRRIQAGYVLGQTAEDKETVLHYEDQLVEFIYRKANIAEKIHCTSRARVGGRSLSSWSSSSSSNKRTDDNQGKDTFLAALADSKPWVYRGDSARSRLVREVTWKGRMFGAFTHDEVHVLRTWIDSLPPAAAEDSDPSLWAAAAYWDLVGEFQSVEKKFDPPRRDDVAVTHPVFPPMRAWDHLSPSPSLIAAALPGRFTSRAPLPVELILLAGGTTNPADTLHRDKLARVLVPLWFAHPCLLETVVSASPYKTTTPLVSLCLQLLRAEKGYMPEGSGIACMDEQHHQQQQTQKHTQRGLQNTSTSSPDLVTLGLHMVDRHDLVTPRPGCLGDVLPPCGQSDDAQVSEAVKFAYDLLSWAQRPIRNGTFLLGLSRAFLDLEVLVAGTEDLLDRKERGALQRMIERKLVGFDKCIVHLMEEGDGGRKYGEFVVGYETGRDELERLLM